MTAKQYAEADREMLKQGTKLEDLNAANHAGLAAGKISQEQFAAAARVLAEEILKR